MSPERTLIFAHLFLRRRPGIFSPFETVLRIFFHERGERKRRENDGEVDGTPAPDELSQAASFRACEIKN